MTPSPSRLPVLLAALVAVGCGGPELCARSAECGAGLVCGFDARCAPLSPPEGARFASSRWLRPLDWGTAGAGEPLDDSMPVGDGAESLLAFGPLPEPSQILRALLVLHPHAPGERLVSDSEVVVEHVEPFRGGALPRRHGRPPLPFAAARRPLSPGPQRPLRIDVTEAARSASGGDLHLLLRRRGGGGEPLRFASPWYARTDARPRLELLTH